MKRWIGLTCLFFLVGCGSAGAKNNYPSTNVQIVTDWTNSGGSDWEREIKVNDHNCIEYDYVGGGNGGGGISCDWSAK